MSEMLERAARALFDMHNGIRAEQGKETNWLKADALTREKYTKEVRAVLLAFREPTEEELEAAGETTFRCAGTDEMRAFLQAMIDAALEVE